MRFGSRPKHSQVLVNVNRYQHNDHNECTVPISGFPTSGHLWWPVFLYPCIQWPSSGTRLCIMSDDYLSYRISLNWSPIFPKITRPSWTISLELTKHFLSHLLRANYKDIKLAGKTNTNKIIHNQTIYFNQLINFSYESFV